MGMYYNRDGEPIDMMEWARLFGDWEYKRVVQTMVRGHKVSTVWMGLDHSIFGDVPVIFETMIFAPGDVEGSRVILTATRGDEIVYVSIGAALFPLCDIHHIGMSSRRSETCDFLLLNCYISVSRMSQFSGGYK